jgi:chromate reductase
VSRRRSGRPAPESLREWLREWLPTDGSPLADTAVCTRSSTKGAIVSDIRVLGFAGSLRRASYNRGLIRAAAEVAPTGIVVDVFDLGDVPLYNQDVEDAGEPAAVVAFKQAIGRADAMLVATPEYNHGVPGVLKNALDWASRPRVTSPLRDKAVAVTGASPGRGSTARAQAQLRDAFVFTGACVMPLPELLIGSAGQHFDDDGNLTDRAVRASLAELIEALRAWTVRIDLGRRAA